MVLIILVQSISKLKIINYIIYKVLYNFRYDKYKTLYDEFLYDFTLIHADHCGLINQYKAFSGLMIDCLIRKSVETKQFLNYNAIKTLKYNKQNYNYVVNKHIRNFQLYLEMTENRFLDDLANNQFCIDSFFGYNVYECCKKVTDYLFDTIFAFYYVMEDEKVLKGELPWLKSA